MTEIIERSMKLKVDDQLYKVLIDTFGNLYLKFNDEYFEMFVDKLDKPIFYKVMIDEEEPIVVKPNKLEPKLASLHEKAEDVVTGEIEYNVEDNHG